MKEAEIILTAERHQELAVAETQANMLKAFLEKRLNEWQGIPYNDVKAVCDMLGIERRDDE